MLKLKFTTFSKFPSTTFLPFLAMARGQNQFLYPDFIFAVDARQ